jgi:hypothetical protein
MIITSREPFEIKAGNSKGIFILKFINPDNACYNLFIFGHQGEKKWERTGLIPSGIMELMIDLDPVSEGVYVLLVESNRKTWTRRLSVTG